WERTFAWTAEAAFDRAHYSETAVAELAGVKDADVLIVLLPGGYGTHVEIGAALALEKRVVMHAPDKVTLDTPYPCVFHYHPNVTRLISERLDINALVDAITF